MTKNIATLKSQSGVNQGHWKWYHSIHWIWFPISVVPLLKGFPLESGIGAGAQKTRMMRLPGRQRSLTISSAVWMECMNVTDRWMDGQTDRRIDTGPQQMCHVVKIYL